MEFQRRKIRHAKPERQLSPRSRQLIAIIGSVILALLLARTALGLLHRTPLKQIVFFLGKDMEIDTYGHTNILLLGTGGGDHDGADLTDTIIVASIDQKTNKITMLSIPRDLYVENKKTGGTRINNLYQIGKNEIGSSEIGMQMLKDEIEKVTNIPIHYYVKVEFKGFEQIVNHLDGIDVNLPEGIYDPQYPRGESIGYETFSLSAGQQHLDGETALKYARSRKTTSDFDRSKRQQLILFAIKEKAEQLGIFQDTGKLKSLYGDLQDMIDTDLSLREMITLAETASHIQKDSIVSLQIHDDPTKCGGLLYTPVRDLYGGASVLVSAKKEFADVHTLTDININHPEIHSSNVKLQILNGTKGLGIAAETKIILNRFCLNIPRFGNAESKDKANTIYFLKKDIKEIPGSLMSILQKLIPGVTSNEVPQKYLAPPYASEADIVIQLGQDYMTHKMKDPFDDIIDLIEQPTTGEPQPAVITGEAKPKTQTSSPITPLASPASSSKTPVKAVPAKAAPAKTPKK